MDWVGELWGFFKGNAVAILGLMGAAVSGYFAFISKRHDSYLANRKIDLEADDVLEKRQSRLDQRFDALIMRWEKERETYAKENAELRNTVREQTGHIAALSERTGEQSKEITKLTLSVDQLKARVTQLIAFIKSSGHEPPPPNHEQH